MNELFLQWLMQQMPQVPSLGDIANTVPTGVTTPPFVPGQAGGNDDYLLAQINQILSAPPSPVPSYTPQHAGGLKGFGQGVLAQVPQALAMLAGTFNPQAGEQFQNQLNRREAIRLQGIQAERERIQKQDELRRQVGVDILRDRLKEATTVRAEKRELAAKERLLEIQKQTALDLKASDFDYFKREKNWLLQQEKDNKDYRVRQAERMAIAQSLPDRQKMAFSLEQEWGRLVPDIDITVRRVLADKIAGVDERPLTDFEKQKLNVINMKRATQYEEKRVAELESESALAVQRRAEAAAGGRAGRMGEDEYTRRQNMEGILGRLDQGISDSYHRLKNGEVVPSNQVPRLETYTAKPLSEQENIDELRKRVTNKERVRKELMASTGVQGTVQPGMLSEPTSADELDKAKQIIQMATDARGGKRPPDDQLRNILKANGISSNGIDSIIATQPAQAVQPAKPTTTVQPKAPEGMTEYKYQGQKNIISGLEREIASTESRLRGATPLGGSKDQLRAKLADLKERLEYAKSQLGKPQPKKAGVGQAGRARL